MWGWWCVVHECLSLPHFSCVHDRMGAQTAPGKGITGQLSLELRLLAACSQRGSMLVLRETGRAHARRHVELECRL